MQLASICHTLVFQGVNHTVVLAFVGVVGKSERVVKFSASSVPDKPLGLPNDSRLSPLPIQRLDSSRPTAASNLSSSERDRHAL